MKEPTEPAFFRTDPEKEALATPEDEALDLVLDNGETVRSELHSAQTKNEIWALYL